MTRATKKSPSGTTVMPAFRNATRFSGPMQHPSLAPLLVPHIGLANLLRPPLHLRRGRRVVALQRGGLAPKRLGPLRPRASLFVRGVPLHAHGRKCRWQVSVQSSPAHAHSHTNVHAYTCTHAHTHAHEDCGQGRVAFLERLAREVSQQQTQT